MGWGSLSHQKIKCAICSHEQTLFNDRDTFTCRRCKKTLPTRLALPIGN